MSNDFNEYELVYLIYEHNERALAIMLKRYEEIFKYYLYKNHVGWKDYDILLGEGRELLFYCLRVYNQIHPFFAFFKLCATRLIIRYFRKRRIQEINYDDYELAQRVSEDIATDVKIPIIVISNPIQQAIIDGIKAGKKLNAIAKELSISPKKVYYEFEKLKKSNLNT